MLLLLPLPLLLLPLLLLLLLLLLAVSCVPNAINWVLPGPSRGMVVRAAKHITPGKLSRGSAGITDLCQGLVSSCVGHAMQ
jgi:hypothetical protein